MGIFGKASSYLGIDLGSASTKIVELGLEKGRPKLITYGYAEETTDFLRSSKIEITEKMAGTLRKLLKKSKVTTNKAVAALPTYTVFSSSITLPDMPEKELVEAIKWEAKKFVPMPLEEMILDWKLIGEQGGKNKAGDENNDSADKKIVTKEEKSKKILLTAAPKDLVTKYVSLFKKAELELVSLETESFAMERSLVGNDKSPIMVLDIGAKVTNIIVVSKGVPLVNRSIDLGGFAITKTIANSMNIDLARAEQFKRDFGISSQAGGNNSQAPAKIEFMLNSIINEIKYVMNLYHNQNDEPIEKIILTGGGSLLVNLTEHISTEFGLNVYVGDPWARVSYPVELKQSLAEIGPGFSIAIGAALREIV